MEDTILTDNSENQNMVRPKNWLAESILVTVFCFLPFGIIGIINAAEVNTKWAAGDFKGAAQSASRAKKWTLLGFAIGIVFIVALLIINIYLFNKYNQNNFKTAP